MTKQIRFSEEMYNRLFAIKEGEGHMSFDSVVRTLLLRLDSTVLLRSREEIQNKQQEIANERSTYKHDSLYEVFLGGIIQALHWTLRPNAAISMSASIGESRKKDLLEDSPKNENYKVD